MFSVITPLYNKAPYIEKAIQSVLAQTYQEFEIIIIDDGSTDNSLEIVKQLRITNYETAFDISQLRIIEQANSGVSTARNNGVKAAKYDYIAFLDADDWWEPTFLEEMKNLITDFPEGALYASSYFRVKNGKNTPAKIGVPADFEKGYFDYCKTYATSPWMPVWTGAVVLRKEIFNEMKGFKSHLKLGEDFDLWVRIALKYPVVFLNKPLSNYNQDIDLQSRAVGFHKMWKEQEHYLFNLDYLEKEEQKNENLKQILDRSRVLLLPYLFNKETRNIAKKEINKINWQKQSRKNKILFNVPIFMSKTYWYSMQYLVKLKQKFKK